MAEQLDERLLASWHCSGVLLKGGGFCKEKSWYGL